MPCPKKQGIVVYKAARVKIIKGFKKNFIKVAIVELNSAGQ
jgi:hypothetical protein